MAVYDLNKPLDVQQFEKKIKHLLQRKAKVNLTEKRGQRTLKQNSYLHVLLGYWGLNFGYTLDEAKQYFKMVCKDYFEYEKGGKTMYRSTADLNTKEMNYCIEKFRDFSSRECEFYLPRPNEKDFLDEIQQRLQYYQNERYVGKVVKRAS